MKLQEKVQGKTCFIILDSSTCAPGSSVVQGKPKAVHYSEDGAVYWEIDTQIHQKDQNGNIVGSMIGTAFVLEKSIMQVVVMEERSGIIVAGKAA